MTLIELVVVITLCGICAIFMTMFMVTPMDSYAAQAQRAALVDAADSALRLLAREPALRARLSRTAMAAVRDLTWERTAAPLLAEVERLVRDRDKKQQLANTEAAQQ